MELLGGQRFLEVVTVGAGPDEIASPVTATADRHLVLGLEGALSPAAVPTRSPRLPQVDQVEWERLVSVVRSRPTPGLGMT
jgi:hypothetical protein